MKLNSTLCHIIFAMICIAFPLHNSYGQGSRYTGNYTKSAPIKYIGKSNFVIEGLEISSASEICIALYNCENVTIRNCKLGPSPLKRGIYLWMCKNVTIIDNTFENVQSGMLASTSQEIKFEYNDLTNILGKLKGSDEFGVMAQFIQVSGAGSSISYNVCENFPGDSSPEDLININQSNGTAESPIVVRGNWIRGGGPSGSGGGINLGDIGGSYQIAEDNVLVNPGQYGIAISGGNNMTLRNNKVYGTRNYFTNVGMTMCNWYGNLGASYNITAANNSINYTNKDGYVNNWWIATNMEPVSGKETNRYDSSINESILPDKIIGRAISSTTPTDPNPGGGTVVIPDDKTGGTGETGGTDQTGGTGETAQTGETEQPGFQLPDIINHPSIIIYLDSFNRICINITGRILKTATATVYDNTGNVAYQKKINRFHNVLPYRPTTGKYYILVRNGEKANLKTIYIK